MRIAVKVERRDVLAERKDASAAKVTFKEAAIQYHAENEGGWKSKTYARQWLLGLETYAFPRLGKETTGSITAADIIATLSPIWQTIPETARQVCYWICVVLDYAHAKGWRSSEAPSGNGSLKAGRGLPETELVFTRQLFALSGLATAVPILGSPEAPGIAGFRAPVQRSLKLCGIH